MQAFLRMLYPPQCVSCDALVDQAFHLCAECWRDTYFIGGLVCDACGTPLPGEDSDTPEYCDDCITIARPWTRGRSVALYKGRMRRLVLAIKHGDRLDMTRPAARWMANTAEILITPATVIVPVPVHRARLLSRRFNQAAVLANEMARCLQLKSVPDALMRIRQTAVQDGMGRDERFRNLAGSIVPHPKRLGALKGRDILLIDDVFTSGATFAAATEACHAAGADQVCVLALARVAKDA
jgi:ComF family protein